MQFHFKKINHRQAGVTLIELMVGIAIGLLVVAVSMGALMVSRGVSGTVSDASGIQQQGAYVMRVIGSQLRQAGSLFLNPNPTNVAADFASSAPVAFETKAPAVGSGNTFDPATDTLSAPSGALRISFRRYKESVHTAATDQTVGANCVGGPSDSSTPPNTDQRIESIFELNGSNLRCQGNGGLAQPIAQNVADFQVRYLVQDNTVAVNPTIQYVAAAAVTDWSRVQAVEVCIVLYGNEPIEMPADGTSTYRGCDAASTPIDMATLTGVRARRLHIAYRNVFQLRSQGLIGTVL